MPDSRERNRSPKSLVPHRQIARPGMETQWSLRGLIGVLALFGLRIVVGEAAIQGVLPQAATIPTAQPTQQVKAERQRGYSQL